MRNGRNIAELNGRLFGTETIDLTVIQALTVMYESAWVGVLLCLGFHHYKLATKYSADKSTQFLGLSYTRNIHKEMTWRRDRVSNQQQSSSETEFSSRPVRSWAASVLRA